ncbi:hypothetical protein [Siminovitchia terrae]|uniref:hypothetical protein n=1 Tax=Siminovitchia terrae TaxID=1914933 RepID=UPI0028B06FCD|nr:hypothetical protein [Siminovitchia terrae]
MASIEKVGKNKYRLIVELGRIGLQRKKKKKTVEARIETEAKKQLVLFEAKILSNNLFDLTNLTVNAFYGDWVVKYAPHHYGDLTFIETWNILKNRLLPNTVMIK